MEPGRAETTSKLGFSGNHGDITKEKCPARESLCGVQCSRTRQGGRIEAVLAPGHVDIDGYSESSGDTALLYAIREGNAQAVRTLISWGADVTKPNAFNEKTQPIRLAHVHSAVNADGLAILELLEE